MTLGAPTSPDSAWARAVRFASPRYFTVDLRTLALFRVAFGVFLLGNLYDRMRDGGGAAFFTDLGVLPARVVMENLRAYQWSLMFRVTTLAQLHLVIGVIVLVYVAYTLGWHTRWMQALVLVAILSLDQRNLLLENGGAWVMAIAAVGTLPLPLGARWSIDAMRAGAPPPDGSVTRLAYGLLVLDLALIYLLNALHKSGPSWRDGTAIHLTLWHARVANANAGWLRLHEPGWLSPLLTRGTLAVELILAPLILWPWRQKETRRVAIVLILSLHGGIAILMTLGPFPYVMICLSLLLVGKDDWDALEELAQRRGLTEVLARGAARLDALGRRKPGADPPGRPQGLVSPAFVARARDVATVVVAAAALCSLLHENRVPEPFHIDEVPAWAASIVGPLRIMQKWTMFSPDAPRLNANLVVDGELPDHTHVDPLTGAPPDMEPTAHVPVARSNAWRDYLFRIEWERYSDFLPYFRDYLLRAHTLPGARIKEPLVHVDVYWIGYRSPPRAGEPPTDVQARLLISGDAPQLP